MCHSASVFLVGRWEGAPRLSCGLRRCFLRFFLAWLCRSPSEYIAAILELSSLVVKRQEQIFLHMDFLYNLTPDGRHFRRACNLVHNFTDAVIRERRRALISGGSHDFLKAKAKAKTMDFIDVLLLAKVGFPGTRIQEIEWTLTSNVTWKKLYLIRRVLGNHERCLRKGEMGQGYVLDMTLKKAAWKG